MGRSHLLVALVVSALVAALALALVAWMTSGSWSPSRVRLGDVALVFPIFIALKLGFDRTVGLVVCFLIYWVVAFGILAWYIKSTRLQLRPAATRE